MQAQSVTLDFLKPVGTVVDLSDKFNARVGDSMTPFNLFVTEGGKPKALNGLHPELEAAVGDGELKDGKAVMSDNAKGIHWVGSAKNVTGYNRLTLTFPAEVFPQSGFCYGHLILANDAGVRESSVDIWFKVLDGLEIMGLAADYYDSAIELELKKLKEANSQAEQRLSEMNLQPEMYADLDAVKAAYPNGATKLIVTDDGYLALYQNGQWVQGPVYQAVGLSKQVSDRIKGIQQRNLIPDAEFADDLTKSWIIEPNVALRTDPSDKFHGHTPAVLEKTSADAQGGVALVIPTPTSECSFSVQTKWAPGDSNSLAFINIVFFASNDGSGEPIGRKVITLDTAVSDWKQRGFINFTPPFNAASARFEMRIQGTGKLKVAVPLLTDWPQNAPYDVEELYQDTLSKSRENFKQVSDRIKGIQQRNLIPDAEFADDLTKSWIIEPNVALRTDPSDKFHGHTPAVLEKTSADAQGGVALVIPTPTSECSFSVQTKWAPGDSNSLAFINIAFFASNDGSGESIGRKVITLDTAVSDWKQRGFINFTPPFNAASARLEMRIQGTGTLKIAVPLLTSWSKNAPYDIDELYQEQLTKSKTNLIDNADFNIDPMTTFTTNFPIGSVEVIPGKGDPVTGAQGYRGHNVLHLSKKDGKDDFQALSFKVDVMPGIPLSYELFFNFVPTGTGVMYIDNYWLAADGTTVQTDHIDLTSYSNNMWNRLTKNNISVPGGASSLSIYVAINQGDLYLACPRAVNDAFIGGYDSEETMRKLIAARDTNLISNAEFDYFPFPSNSWFSSLDLSKLSIGKDNDSYYGHNSFKIVKDDGNANAWGGVSTAFNYTSGRKLSEMVAFKLNGQDSTSAVLGIDFMDGTNGQGNSLKHTQQMFTTQNQWIEFVKNDIEVPSGTNSVRLGFLINQGTLWIAMPTAVESANVGPHDYDMLSKRVTDHLKIPIIRLSALDTNPLSADTYQNYRMEWIEPMRTITGYAKLAWQGDSSLNLEKKNYKFKLFSDEGFTKKFKFKPYPEFYRSNTFHLKANFTNRYLINNGYNADMYRQFIFANDTAPQKLIDASHQGMICARPVLVYLNSQFMGVYTVNTKKGSDLYNTDEKDKNQIAIQSNGGEGARWTKAVGLTFGETEGCDFEIESDNTEAVESAVGRLATFIVNSSDTDFKNNLSQYFNVKSLLDYIIFADLTINTDGLHVKNSTYVTYDAQVWYILPYDLDSTLGSYWDPTKPQDPDTSVVGQLNTNLLKRVYKLFRDELKQRVAELRTAGVLDKSKWFTEWEKRVNEIGEPLLETEWQRWPNNPAYSRGTSYNEVLSLINHRFKRLDWDF